MYIVFDDNPTDILLQVQTCQVQEITFTGTPLAMVATLTDCDGKLRSAPPGDGNPLTFVVNGEPLSCGYSSFNMWADGSNYTQTLQLSADCIEAGGDGLVDNTDTDGDLLTLSEELVKNTDPNSADTDGDGIPDNLDPSPGIAAGKDCTEDANGDVSLANVTYTSVASCSATRNLFTGNAVQVNSGATVTYQAGATITLLPGFSVQNGATFSASIGTTALKTVADTTAVASATFTIDNGSIADVTGAIPMAQDGLPATLRSILDQYGAEATDIFADATGSYIVFATQAGLSGSDNNDVSDIYLFEIQTETLHPLSVNSDGVTADGASVQPRIDGGGNYVVFTSKATDLVGDDTNGVADIFLSALAIGSMERVSFNESGQQAKYAAENPAIGSIRPQVLYDRTDDSGNRQIYSYDYDLPELGTVQMDVADGLPVASDRHHPAVSPDGRFVAYLNTMGDDPATTECFLVIYDQIDAVVLTSTCPKGSVVDGQYSYFSVSNDGMITY